MKIDSLKKKTILFIFIITILCIAGSSLIASKVVEKQMTDNYRADKETAMGIISHSLASMLDLYDYKQVEHLITSFLGYANIASVAVFDAGGTLIRSAVERNVSAEDLDMEKREITTSMRGIIGSVEIGFSKKYIHKQILTMTVALVFGLMGFFIIVGFGIYAFMSRSIIKPLESFTETVKEMNSENLSARVQIRREDEIGVLATSFNQMAENLEESHRALRESEERYRLLFQNIPVGLFRNTPGPGGKWIMANPAIARIFGYETVRDFFQTSVVDFYEDPAGRPGFSEKLFAQRHVVREELRMKKRNGTTIWVAVSADAVWNESGEVEYFDGMVEDITERKLAEEVLRKAHDELELKVAQRTSELSEANTKLKDLDQLKSIFIASMSHELRTPLNSIIGFTGLILQGISGEVSPEVKEDLQIVYDSSKHLLSLINDVIDISKIEADRLEVYFEEIKLDEVFNDAVTAISRDAEEKKLEIRVDCPKDLSIVSDRKRLFQCVLNLMSNAVKYIEKGSIKLRAVKKADILEISVADTGIGIKEEDISKLFTSFVRLDSPLEGTTLGTGLGLYLTKKIMADVFDGDIRVESRYGKGSVFTLIIPLNKRLTS